MSFADTKEAFETRYQTQVLVARPGLPIQFPNAPFDRPERSEWTRFTLIEPAANRTTIGSTTNANRRYFGRVVISIFVPERSDTILVNAIADDVDAIFKEAKFSLGSSGNIRCRVPRLVPIGVDPDGFWQSQVQTDYERCLVS